MILKIMIDTYEWHRFARSVSKSKVKVIPKLKIHTKRTGQSLLMIHKIMIATYERHRFARSRSRSKVKVICVLVVKLKKKFI
jgi:hypothetical protein